MNRKYEVQVKEMKGTCDSPIFRKMAMAGDITADKLADHIGEVTDINGYALCHIVTNEKEFDMNYYSTGNGFIQSGSEVFASSVANYFGEVENFKIIEVKTKKGKTYKVSPILEIKEDAE